MHARHYFKGLGRVSKGILITYISFFLFAIELLKSHFQKMCVCGSCSFMLCFFMLTSCIASLTHICPIWLFKSIISVSYLYSQFCNPLCVSLSFLSKTGFALGYIETSSKCLFFAFKYGGFAPHHFNCFLLYCLLLLEAVVDSVLQAMKYDQNNGILTQN